MLRLDMLPNITLGDVHSRLLCLEKDALLAQQGRQTENQCPKAHDGRSLDHLALVRAGQILVVLKENLSVPADSQGVHDRLGLSLYQSATPTASLRQGFVLAETSKRLCDKARESVKGTLCFAFCQPQQHDQVRTLALTEARVKSLQKLAQRAGKARVRLGRGPPPWQ